MTHRLALASLLATLPFGSPSLAAHPFPLQDAETSSVSRIVDGGFDLTVKTSRKTRTLDDGSVETTETVEMEASLDGKPIPQERIRRTGDRVEILDEKGEVIRSAVVGIGGSNRPAREIATAGSPVAAPPARPMLGVTLEEPGEPLVKQLRLAPGRTTLLTSIVPGSPAAKAGLETYDVVVGIGGREDASPEAIRDFLGGAKVGDAVSLAIVRGGERREVTVTLEAMSDAMAARSAPGVPLDPEVREMLEQLRARGIDIDPGMLGGNQGVIVAPAPGGFGGGSMRFVLPQGGTFVVPGGGPDFAELEERMRRMQQQMERAMQQFERVRPAPPPAPAPAPPPSGREA